jgi:hypothetical protein
MSDPGTNPQGKAGGDLRAWDLRWSRRAGKPVQVGDTTITPESQALEVRWPGGGFVWNHPAAVLIERGGETERAPIRDETRAAQVAALTIAAVAGAIAVWAWYVGRRA